jgi:hypothetical protein
VVGGAGFCVHCGARLSSPLEQPGTGPKPAGTLLDEALAGCRRFWPALAMVAYLGYFDYRMHGSLISTVLLGGLAAAPMLFWARVRPFLDQLEALIPARFLRPVVVGIPAALLYMARWKGTQDDTSAFLTAVVIGGFGFLVAVYRPRLNALLAPLYRRRNRVLPRPLRLVLVFALPILLTFLIVHRNLGDIGAVLGGKTSSPRSPTAGSSELAIVVATVLSASAAFVLLNDPAAERGP